MNSFWPLLNRRLRPRVVHRLPGRMRVNVPILRLDGHVAPEQVAPFRRLFCLLEGIEDVEASLITGNLLVRYDPEQVSEAGVLAHLHSAAKLVYRLWPEISQVPLERVEPVAMRMEDVLRDSIARGETLEEVSVPDDVWA